jgi:MFS family permease
MLHGMNRLLMGGLVLFLAGVARDLQWHATHDTQTEFETASKQIEVHWLLWLGTLVLLVGSWLALGRPGTAGRKRGYLISFVSSVVYAAVSVWHFVEHANGNDPELAHLFLYVGAIGIVAGVTLALLDARRAPTPPAELEPKHTG